MSRARESSPRPVEDRSNIYVPVNLVDRLDWQKVFAREQPVEIDVGCGKGGFLLWAAGQRPMHNVLGVERQLVRLRKVDRKAHLAGLTNVRLLQVEAGLFVEKLVPDHSVMAYHIFFPDPWPKRRHHPRRLFQVKFVGELERTLVSGGAVNVATDNLDYFAHIQKVMATRFRELPADPLPVEAQTEFEKIFLAQGKPVGRAKFVR